MAKKTVTPEALKAFIRKEASRFLKQPNVTSVGVGYKIKDGKPTKELSIQFTVDRKVAPQVKNGVKSAVDSWAETMLLVYPWQDRSE